MNRRESRGLTLIEIMVVVAVLAILATIVIPTYDTMMRSIRRADGRAALGAIATAEERYFSIYQRYVGAPDEPDAYFAALVNQAGLDPGMVHKRTTDGKWVSPKERYVLSVVAGPSGEIRTSFEARADPEVDDKNCQLMKLNSLGVRTGDVDSGAENKCW